MTDGLRGRRMPTRGRPRAGPAVRAAPRPRMDVGSRVAEIDDATDRVLQGRSWGCPFQPFAARSSDVPAGGTPDGRTTLLPLTRRISTRGVVGNNVEGRFHGRKTIPLPSRTFRLNAGPPGRLSREPEQSDTWHPAAGAPSAAAIRRHSLPQSQARPASSKATTGSTSRARRKEKRFFPAGRILYPAKFPPETFGTECANSCFAGGATS